MTKLSLNEFACRLRSAESATRLLKDTLLRDAGVTLHLDTVDELAQLVAWWAVLATVGKGKAALEQVREQAREQGLSGSALEAAYLDAQVRLPLHKLVLRKSGSLEFEKDGLPKLAHDGAKLATVLQSPYGLAASLNIAQHFESEEFIDARDSIATHPVKLSYMPGQGGFVKHAPRATESFPFCVSEEDFLTRQTATLVCSSAHHPNGYPLLTWVSYKGNVSRLSFLLRQHPDICADLSSRLLACGLTDGPALVAALSHSAKKPAVREVPQVFVGPIPDAEAGVPVEQLSVFTPFSLIPEVCRARESLISAFTAEAVAQLDADIECARQQGQEREVKSLQKRRKQLETRALHVPSTEIPHGGSSPQNVAMDVGLSAHSANVVVNIPAIRTAPVDRLVARAYRPESLVVTPQLPRMDAAPAFLRAQASGAEARRSREKLFTKLATEALGPLLELQDALAMQIQAKGSQRMKERDMEHVASQESDWALFVQGNSSLSAAEAAQCLRPLATRVYSHVCEALQVAYSKVPMSPEFNAQLMDVIAQVVLRLRA